MEKTARRPTRVPTQTRAKLTVEKILQAAADHLAEYGLTGFTTNAVADEAGVNIATLYSYFPDKGAILKELLARYDAERTDRLADGMAALGTEGWRDWVDQGIDQMVKLRMKSPAAIALRRAVAGTPELHAVDREYKRRLAAAMAPHLRTRDASLSSRDAQRVCEVAMDATIAVLDDACDGPRPDRRKVAELKQMVTAYFAAYLD